MRKPSRHERALVAGDEDEISALHSSWVAVAGGGAVLSQMAQMTICKEGAEEDQQELQVESPLCGGSWWESWPQTPEDPIVFHQDARDAEHG